MSRVKSSRRTNLRSRLITRDGDSCWYCQRPMDMEDISNVNPLSCTIEHLTPRGTPESNREDNCVLAHQMCNVLAGDALIVRKFKLREILSAESDQHFIERKLKIRKVDF